MITIDNDPHSNRVFSEKRDVNVLLKLDTSMGKKVGNHIS